MIAVKQHDVSDCGAACLKSLASHFGRTVSVAQCRAQAGTSQRGTTALGLVEAARGMGFVAKGVRGPFEQIASVPLPAIAHCVIDRRYTHYVVVRRITATRIDVMDPATGQFERWPTEKFKAQWTGVLILAVPADGFSTIESGLSINRWLWKLVAANRSLIFQITFGSMAISALALAMSVYVQKLIDVVLPEANRQLLDYLGVGMLALLGVRVVIAALQSRLALHLAQRMDAALILNYYRHLFRLPQVFFDTMRVGEIAARVGDAVKVREFLQQALLNLLFYPLMILFSVVALTAYSVEMGLLSAAVVAGSAILGWIFTGLYRKAQRRLMERGAAFSAQLVESLHAHSLFRRFQLEQEAIRKTEVRLVQLLKAGWRSGQLALVSLTAGTLLSQSYLIILLWFGATRCLDGRITPGELLSCSTLAGLLVQPLTALLNYSRSLQESLVAAERLCDTLGLPVELDRGTAVLRAGPSCEIRVDNLVFSHAGRLPLLNEVSFRIPAGRITAIAGDSGSGKSTLLALLQRLYQPTQGGISIDGVNVAVFRLESLRGKLGVLTQQAVLFSGSLLENLAPGESEPDMEKLVEICREVAALDFIERLPDGFLSMVVENGANLSGGQRQKIALARLLYRDAPILLLDEPTAALDLHSRSAVLRAIQRRRDAGKTVVMAVHEPAELAIADQVITLSGGRVEGLASTTAPT